MERRLVLLLLVLVLFLTYYAVFINRPPEERERPVFVALGPDLSVLGTYSELPHEVNGLVLIGKTEKGYVYVPKEETYVPTFLDRLDLLAGKETNAGIPVEWWMEYKGVKVVPVTTRAYKGYTLVVRTPYEELKAVSEVVGVYTGRWYMGRAVEANGDCIYVKRWNGVTVPVLLEGKGVVDPDAKVVCRETCENPGKVRVLLPDGTPATGYYTLGSGATYGDFFGRFRGSLEVCGCRNVRIHVSGYKPWSGEVCDGEEVNVVLEGLKWSKVLEGNFVFLDSLGALVSFGSSVTEPGAYRSFVPFPLHEPGRGLPVVEVGEAWLGYKKHARVPVYSIVRMDDNYFYVLENGVIELNGLLCSEDTCFEVGGGTPVLSFGLCRLEWNGFLQSDCPKLGVKT